MNSGQFSNVFCQIYYLTVRKPNMLVPFLVQYSDPCLLCVLLKPGKSLCMWRGSTPWAFYRQPTKKLAASAKKNSLFYFWNKQARGRLTAAHGVTSPSPCIDNSQPFFLRHSLTCLTFSLSPWNCTWSIEMFLKK